jgi:uncharacterized protein DUF1844
MSDEEKKSPFVVRDRRRFDASGNPRSGEDTSRSDDRPSDQRREPAASRTARPEPPRPQTAPPPPRPTRPPPMDDDDEIGEMDHGPMAGGPQGPVGFAEFILSIATNAVIHLGGDTKDGRVPGRVNLPLAAQHIDIIAMLAEKTRGNLDRDEQDLLESLLYDLRMKYVAVAQAQGRGI